METAVQLADLRDDRRHLVHGVIPQVVRGGMGRPARRRDLHLDAAFVPSVHLHPGRLADDHEIGPHLGINLDERVGRDAVAPFFHVAEVVDGVTVEQAQVAGDGQAIHHTGRAVLFIAGAACIEDAVLDLADEGIPFPFAGIADAHGVDVRVVDDHLRPVADAADGVAHLVEARFVPTEFAHFFLDALAHRADLRVHAGDRADVAHELDDLAPLLLNTLVDFLDLIHRIASGGEVNRATAVLLQAHAPAIRRTT